MTPHQIAPPHEAAPPWGAMLPGRPLGGLTVLVVEDSHFASEAVRLLCLRSGARLRRADSLRAAARHLQVYRPAVAIVDMGLPDGDGAGLIARLAGQAPRLPVILGMSGDPGAEAAARAAGADGFLGKPVENLAQFQQAILSALPQGMPPGGLRCLDPGTVRPDDSALRGDLSHIAAMLAGAPDGGAIDHVARFAAGLARAARDAPLEQAATALAQDHAAGLPPAAPLTRLGWLVRDRLAGAA